MQNKSDLKALLENEQKTTSPRPEHEFITLGARARQKLEEHSKELAEEERITLPPSRRSSALAGMVSPKHLPVPPPANRSFSPIYRTGSGSRPNSCPGSRATTPDLCTDSEDEEENIKIECYGLGDPKASSDNSANDSIASLTKLPSDFPLMQQEYAKKHSKYVILSLRLVGKGRATRRISLALVKSDGSIEIADPAKPSKVKSKTQPENSPFSGHILADPILCHPERSYNPKDNSISGNFPLELLHKINKAGVNAFTPEEINAYQQIVGCDDEDNEQVINNFLKWIQTVCKDPKITKAYLYHSMVVYSKIVSYQEKTMPGKTFDVTHEKHFIEEARSLGYIISRIYEGHFQLISYNEKALTFSFENKDKVIVAKLDLTLGIVENLKKVSLEPPTEPQSLEIFTKQSQEETAQQLVTYYEDYLLCHFPLWYIPPGEQEYTPAMVVASDNGLPYAGDMDPEHISMRSDLPWETTISFNGRNGETQEGKDAIPQFMLGMLMVDQRLRAINKQEYAYFITELLKSLESLQTHRDRARSNELVNLELISSEEKLELAKNYIRQITTPEAKLVIKKYLLDIQAHLTALDSNSREFYTYDDKSSYYRKDYLPTLAAAFRTYQLDPGILLTIGQSRINDAVMIYDIDHNMVQHGGDDINPGPTVPPIGKTMYKYEIDDFTDNNRSFIVTRNEKSYLAFLFYDPMILKKANFDVHPSRILDTNPNHLLWCALIKIQALYRARHDAVYGTDFADNFRRILQENYRFRDHNAEYVRQAQLVLDEIFSEVAAIIAQTPLNDLAHLKEKFNKLIEAEYNSSHIKKLTTIVQRQLEVFKLPKAVLHEDTFQAPRSLLPRFSTVSSSSPQVISSAEVNLLLSKMFNYKPETIREAAEQIDEYPPQSYRHRNTLSKL